MKSAVSEPDPNLWQQIASWLWIGILPLVRVVYTKQEERMTRFEADLKCKADESELGRHRINIEKLFDGQHQIEQSMNAGFAELQRSLHMIHTEVLGQMNTKADRTKS